MSLTSPSKLPSVPKFNTKSPTIKRILRESLELSQSPDPTISASPLESNLFEWHFTLSGPPSTPYASGIYHGRIILPPTYPLRPPSFRFLTPSGRFETNREICLSISGHHEESWQPAWGIRTALCAIRAFMAGEAKGQLGGLEMDEKGRNRLASESRRWRCSSCGGKTCEEILGEVEKEVKEREEYTGVKASNGSSSMEESIPVELSLGYRDELGKSTPQPQPQQPTASSSSSSELLSSSDTQPSDPDKTTESTRSGASNPVPLPPLQSAPLQSQSRPCPENRRRILVHPRNPPAETLNPSCVIAGCARPATLDPVPATIGGTSTATATSHSARSLTSTTTPTRTTTTTTTRPRQSRQMSSNDDGGVPAWLDKAILGVLIAFVIMVVKKLML
ncbi:hypothetical protein MMC09_005016 [Bachmanniomyces sp. S44760]|nr:hypothetical protein [Bachmanniomyces sp. S44760]